MYQQLNKLFRLSICLVQMFNGALSSCDIEGYGLYCANTTQTELINYMNNTISNPNNEIRAIFFRNISGELSDASLSLFPKTKSLDVQSSRINSLETNKTVLNNLYLMNNLKFPPLSVTFFQKCCQKLMVLFILDNSGLIINNEAFKNLKELKHLTISKQKVQHMNKTFLRGLNKLTYLNLRDDGIETLEQNTFEDLTNLKYLILSDNKIVKFEFTTFNNLKELESLEFLGLDLINFNISIFKNQKELKTIGLPTKLIKNLKLDQLTLTFKKLDTILLSDNDKASYSVNKFILQCEDQGFVVKYS